MLLLLAVYPGSQPGHGQCLEKNTLELCICVWDVQTWINRFCIRGRTSGEKPSLVYKDVSFNAFMHVHTHICLLTTPKEKVKVAMCGEEAGRTKKERKMCFLSSDHGRKTSQNVREQQLLYYPTLRGDDDTTQAHTHTHFLTPANRLMHHSHKG